MRECAIRETVEELKIIPHQLRVYGAGDIYVSPFNLMIHPFISEITGYENTYSKDEVEEIIKIPLDYFRNNPPKRYESKVSHEPEESFPYEWIPGGKKYPWAKGMYEILFYRYEDYTIWGMTAHIVKSAVELIDQYKLC